MRTAVIIIPTYNEAGNIKELIEGIFKSTSYSKTWQIEVLFVDSQSSDNTPELIKNEQKSNKHIHLLSTKKEGLGKAYVAGFKYAIDTLKAYLVFEMDADLSHNPSDIPKFLKHIESGSDFVVGSRYIPGGSIPSNWGLHRKIFSRCANLFVKYGFMKRNITDWTDGYRAIKVWVVKSAMSHISKYSGYVFQIALLDHAVKHNARISEVPVHFKDRNYGNSKINALQYIVQTVVYVLTNSPFIKFAVVGLIGFVLDFGITHFLIIQNNVSNWIATPISTESAIISNFLMNNYWSFSHKKLQQSRLGYIFKFLKFNFISSGSILIQTIGIGVLTHFFGKDNLLYYKAGIIMLIIIPYSYILYNKFIWKEKK